MRERFDGLFKTGGVAARLRRWGTRGPCCIGILLAWFTSLPAHGAEGCKLATSEIPVSMVGKRALATVVINGTQVPLLVASGAFHSFLTDRAAEQLKLPLKRAPRGFRAFELEGPIDLRVTTVKSLEVGSLKFANIELGVGISETGHGTMGVLGRDILGLRDTEYDLARSRIRLVFTEGECEGGGMAYWAGDTPVVELTLITDDSSAGRPEIAAEARLNGMRILVSFSTAGTSVLSLAAARRAGIAEKEMTPVITTKGLGPGRSRAWLAPLKKFELGGETILNGEVEVAEVAGIGYEMLLGIDFFLSHRIYVATDQRRIFITYNGGKVFDRGLGNAPAELAVPAVASPEAKMPPADVDSSRRP